MRFFQVSSNSFLVFQHETPPFFLFDPIFHPSQIESRKKPSYFPFNPGSFIGILISCFFFPPIYPGRISSPFSAPTNRLGPFFVSQMFQGSETPKPSLMALKQQVTFGIIPPACRKAGKILRPFTWKWPNEEVATFFSLGKRGKQHEKNWLPNKPWLDSFFLRGPKMESMYMCKL